MIRPDIDADPTAAATTPLLRVRNLSSPHAGPFSLDLEPGECVTVMGPSGSGKSVFLRMIADLDPNTGEVALDGCRRETCPAPTWRSQVVYQPAEPAWWEATAAAHFDAGQAHIVENLLPQLALRPTLLDDDIGRLSTGERQRLALARSLARRPRVLLLDEPTSALDEESTLAVECLLREQLRAGLAVLLVTHSERQAERLGRRRLKIRDGRLEAA